MIIFYNSPSLHFDDWCSTNGAVIFHLWRKQLSLRMIRSPTIVQYPYGIARLSMCHHVAHLYGTNKLNQLLNLYRAIPTDEALQTIADVSPLGVVEVHVIALPLLFVTPSSMPVLSLYRIQRNH